MAIRHAGFICKPTEEWRTARSTESGDPKLDFGRNDNEAPPPPNPT
jgi:hypothetical protein